MFQNRYSSSDTIAYILTICNSDILFVIRDRPAAFPVNVTAIDDTKNFDEFPEVELNFSKFFKIPKF